MLWKIGGGLLALAAFALIVVLYGKAQYRAGHTDGELTERVLWKDKVAEAADARLTGFQLGIALQREGEISYQRTITEKLVPVTRTIIERATEYASTPDGKLLCLSPDRVRGLDEARSTLFPAPAAPAPGGSVGAVLADAPGQEP